MKWIISQKNLHYITEEPALYHRRTIMQSFHLNTTPSAISNNSNILRTLYQPLPNFVLHNGQLTISTGTIEILLTLQDNTLCFQLTMDNVEVELSWNDDRSFWEQTMYFDEHVPAKLFLNSFWRNVRDVLR